MQLSPISQAILLSCITYPRAIPVLMDGTYAAIPWPIHRAGQVAIESEDPFSLCVTFPPVRPCSDNLQRMMR
jgi:hypothetical protein